MEGVYNALSPQPVSNKELMLEIAREQENLLYQFMLHLLL
jgi:NAD dependent epimerase/dehydratase family enzyme